MGLVDVAKSALQNAMQGVLDKIIRNTIAYAICIICAVAILILATSAAVMALAPLVGAIYAQLIVAGVFLVVIIGTMIWLQRTDTTRVRAVPVAAAPEEAAPKPQFAQLAMIIEAVMLGYSMSKRR